MSKTPKHPRGNRIAQARKKASLSQAGLADLVGAHWITISKLERGEMQLTASWLDRLAEQLHVGPEDLLPLRTTSRTIAVEGTIEVGGRVLTYNQPRQWTIERDTEYDIGSMWMAIDGEALWPLFQDGDLIRFVQVDDEHLENYLGRLCIAVERPQTPESRGCVGFLDQGSRAGRYDVRPMNMPPRRDLDLEVLWVAVEARFRPGWEKNLA